LQLVDHIEFKKELYPSGRFAHVFTSLQAVAMVKYDKVIVLDRELFEREALVAVRRHPQGKYLD
jgi:alpha-N-acetylglucosamine transferase